MSVECPECGENFEALGQHWRFNPEHKPSFTDEQMEILTGMLMGDGCIERKGGNHHPKFITAMTNLEYLQYLREIFGKLSVKIKEGKSPSQRKEEAIENGFVQNTENEWKDIYWFKIRAHGELNSLSDWYNSGRKVWPDDIELTPTVLKHFYVCDGNFHNNKKSKCIRFALSNEHSNKEKVNNMFSRVGFEVSNWRVVERTKGGVYSSISFTKSESNKMFEYMGKPLPGFEYKWPEKYK